MFQRFASSAFVAGALLTALLPAVGLARDHGNSGGGRSFSGGSHNSAPRGGGSRESGRQNFVSPHVSEGRRGYSSGPSYYSRGYVAPRSYARPAYRGYYGGGVYLGVPYGYAYGSGYAYDPGYAYGPDAYGPNGYDPGYSSGSYAPAPAPQTCSQGSYDRNGTWIPNPNCYSDQQQYPPQQQNYNSNQQQYAPQQQPYYDPNQQQYSQPQQNYSPTQPQQYGR